MTTRVLVQACPKYLILGLCVYTSLVGHEDFLKASQRGPFLLIRKKREGEKKDGVQVGGEKHKLVQETSSS